MNLMLILGILSFIVLTEAKREPKFAPYIDVTYESDFKLLEYKQKYGVKAFSLAFALGSSAGCVPSWGGSLAIDDKTIIDQVQAFKAAGGDVIVSTGGALSPYLETACGSADALAGAYKKALSATGSTHLDIDIESTVTPDIMNGALAILQKENPAITVSFTLRVLGDDYGVTDLNVLQSAVKLGVNVDIVNPMTMEFGTKLSSWGDAVIAAGEATATQMKTLWPEKSVSEIYSMLGITPMLGHNYNGKIFTQDHAKQLVAWAKQKGIGHLGFWSMNRDRGCPGGGVSPTCSGIAQEDWEFTKIFVGFDDGSTPPTQDPNHTTASPPSTQPTTHKSVDPLDCSDPKNDNKYYPDEKDCSKYYWCYQGQSHVEHCGAGTIWDTAKNICNFPADVNRPECK